MRKQVTFPHEQSIIANPVLITPVEIFKEVTPFITTRMKTSYSHDKSNESITENIQCIELDYEYSTNVPRPQHYDNDNFSLKLKMVPTPEIETEAINQALPVLKPILKPKSISKRQIRVSALALMTFIHRLVSHLDSIRYLQRSYCDR